MKSSFNDEKTSAKSFSKSLLVKKKKCRVHLKSAAGERGEGGSKGRVKSSFKDERFTENI